MAPRTQKSIGRRPGPPRCLFAVTLRSTARDTAPGRRPGEVADVRTKCPARDKIGSRRQRRRNPHNAMRVYIRSTIDRTARPILDFVWCSTEGAIVRSDGAKLVALTTETEKIRGTSRPPAITVSVARTGAPAWSDARSIMFNLGVAGRSGCQLAIEIPRSRDPDAPRLRGIARRSAAWLSGDEEFAAALSAGKSAEVRRIALEVALGFARSRKPIHRGRANPSTDGLPEISQDDLDDIARGVAQETD